MNMPPEMPAPVLHTKQMTYKGETFDVDFRETRRPFPIEPGFDLAKIGGMAATAHGFCAPFNQRTYEPLPGIICEQDVAVKMRDGVTIYVDIYRPKSSDERPVPAIFSWSCFGKRPGDGMSEWQVMGVSPGSISTMAKFESADPGYWCHYDYAIINVDPRGTGFSEGDINLFTQQEREDGYDTIEWVAEQPWCSGKVGMFGNSMVAMTQLRIAGEQPPHLVCIAPWEATTDIYRDSMFEGGVPALSFNEFIVSSLTGQGLADDQVANAKRYPLMHPYWEAKIPDYDKIRIPMYMCAGWSHFHLRGTMNAWRKIKSRKKWLRFHREFEWPDTYHRDNIADLHKFFDRYLKDIQNGWESTPRVRLEVMDAYDFDYQTNRPEKFFPLKRTEYKKLYLDAGNMSMGEEKPAVEATAGYDGNTEELNFDITFNEETELTGFMKLHLFVEAESHNQADIFLTVKKADKDGNFVPWNVINEPHPGAWGRFRLSHRELDEKLSTSFNPVQAHRKEEEVEPGKVYEVDIEIVPSSRIWHPGERLRLEIAGRYIREEWFEPFSWETDNKGKIVVHTGGEKGSYLQVPFIPPRYQVGDYIVR